MGTFIMTATAEETFWDVIDETLERWGVRQADKYLDQLVGGFQYIADHHETLGNPHRYTLTKGTQFSVHLVVHRYIAYVVRKDGTVIIAGLFYERMDIPACLKDLESLGSEEIAALMAE